MMTVRILFAFCFVFVCQFVLAQNNPATSLNEVVIADIQLKNFSSSQTKLQFNDSIISKNQASLTDLLNYNSPIYFKQYGRGMLSTVSFRGTTASQTAVVWNGININSQLNGSTDFNTITSSNFNSITVKPGGGSVIYGSGAIGGTVHLNNDLNFRKQFTNRFQLAYGSFNSLNVNCDLNVSNEKWSTQIGFSNHSSTNDYLYLDNFNWKGEQRRNLNGEYVTTSLNANFGYKINSNQYLKFYSQNTNTNRNISLLSESDTKTKYSISFSRNLLNYSFNFDRFATQFKIAYIQEMFQYFPNIDKVYFSYGKTENLISKADLGCQIVKSIKVNTIVDYNHTKGYGTNLGNNIRDITSVALLIKNENQNKWINELGVRKEYTTNYKSPVLFSFGSTYSFSKSYTLKINTSRNFRIPTYNDLYWDQGGNPNLKPESSYQAEVGNIIEIKKIKLTQNFFYNNIKDLIVWTPSNKGFWTPQNTDKVETYGSESIIGYENNLGKHKIELNGTYSYTISKDIETKKQLFFVPFHKLTAAIAYNFKRFSADYQFLYNGFVYTRSDNNPKEIIQSYKVSNMGIYYNAKLLQSLKIGFQVLNFLNEKYQTLEERPFPGRNFNININLKF
jgi:outer membrane cobalamin receptor